MDFDFPADLRSIEEGRDYVAACLARLHDANPGALTRDDQRSFDDGVEYVRQATELIKRHENVARLAGIPGARESWQSGIAATMFNRMGSQAFEAARSARPADLRGLAISAIEGVDHLTPAEAERATFIVDRTATEDHPDAARWALASANPAYLRAFASLVRNPERGHLAWDDETRQAFNEAEAVKRGMTSFTGSSGGYMVPMQLDPSIIITSAGTLNDIRTISRNVTLVAGNTWKGVSSAGVSAEWKTEAAQAADATPTLAQPDIPVHLADVFVPYSFEAEQDDLQLVRELAKLAGDAKEVHEATAFTNGDGSGKPTGIVYTITAVGGSEVAPTTAETFAVADVFKTYKALPARHMLRASWLANPVTYVTIRQLLMAEDGAEGVWQDFGQGKPPSMIGRPTYHASDMDSTDGILASETATNDVLLAGDFENYVIVDRLGATVEIVAHIPGANGRPTGQRGFFYYWRVGAEAVNTDAFRLLAIPTAA